MAEEDKSLENGEGGGEPKDWKAEARKWESRAKANFEKAKAYDEAQEAGKSELEKARAKAEKLDSELKAVKAKAAHDEAVAKVAKETGVPASLIKGETEDEMRDFAKSVAEYAKPATGARTPKNGACDHRGASNADEAKRLLAKQIF